MENLLNRSPGASSLVRPVRYLYLFCVLFVVYCVKLDTVRTRYKEVPRDWENLFVITGVCYIGVL